MKRSPQRSLNDVKNPATLINTGFLETMSAKCQHICTHKYMREATKIYKYQISRYSVIGVPAFLHSEQI